MKVLHFIFPITGPNNGVKVISNHIRNSIFNDLTLKINVINTAQAEEFSNFGKFRFKKVFHFFKLFKKLLSIHSGDMVYVNVTPRGFAFYRDFLILYCCSLRTSNITAHLHANGLEKKINGYNKFLFRKLKIIVINKDQKKKLDKLAFNTFLVPNSLPDYFEAGPPIYPLDEEMKLIFLSNISKEKGIDRLERIAEIVSANNLKCRMNVFGGALTITDKDKIDELNSNYGFLNYHGPISLESIKYSALSNNDVLLFLSDENYEVYPLVYIEALMAGVPILTTKQIISEDFIGLGVIDELNGNMNNFESIILNYFKDSKEFLERKKKAREVYGDKYSYRDFIKKIEKIILSENK